MKVSSRSKSWVADQGLTHWVRDGPQSVKAIISGGREGRESLYEEFVAMDKNIPKNKK